MSESAVMSDAPVFRMDPADVRAYGETFRRDGIVQIRNIFDPAFAEQLEKTLKDDTYWRLTYADEKHKAVALNSEQLAKTDLQALAGEILKRAGDGFSYVYLACHLQNTYGGPGAAAHPLHKLFNLLNSPEFLAFGREVSGHSDVVRIDATATWYRPGDFLTMHTDQVGLRRTAYTLGFTRGWRADWGGQLLFHTPAGDVERGFMPAFNVLTMFNIPRNHSVAQVAHYAKERRLTVSGWLIAPQPSAQPQPLTTACPAGH
jgi:SM-20-related protein